MRSTASTVAVVSVVVVLVVVALLFLYKRQVGREKVSRFGKYQGYSAAVYDGNERRSDYLKLSNGTWLAYDLFLPTKKGVAADKPLPVLFQYTPYTLHFAGLSGAFLEFGNQCGWDISAIECCRVRRTSRAKKVRDFLRCSCHNTLRSLPGGVLWTILQSRRNASMYCPL